MQRTPEMGAHRTQARMVGDILAATRDSLEGADGAPVTYLVRSANIPHSRLCGMLRSLVSAGLLEQAAAPGAARYTLSDQGREFLHAYRTFSSFADELGLTI